MALETASWVTQLVDTNPTVSDPVAQGDDHLRMVKTVLKNSFPSSSTAKPGLAAVTVPQEVSVPSLVKYLPDCPETLGTIAVVDEEGKLFFKTVFNILR